MFVDDDSGMFPLELGDMIRWYIGNADEELLTLVRKADGGFPVYFCPAAVGQSIRAFFTHRFPKEDINKFKFFIAGHKAAPDAVLPKNVVLTLWEPPSSEPKEEVASM